MQILKRIIRGVGGFWEIGVSRRIEAVVLGGSTVLGALVVPVALWQTRSGPVPFGSGASDAVSIAVFLFVAVSIVFLATLLIRMFVTSVRRRPDGRLESVLPNADRGALIVSMHILWSVILCYAWNALSFPLARDARESLFVVQLGVAANFLALGLRLRLFAWLRPTVFVDSLEWRSVVCGVPSPGAQASVLAGPVKGHSTDASVLDVVQPRVSFSDADGMDDLKSKLIEVARPVVGNVAGASVANGVLLFGPPGNGKTFFAEALAGELGVRFALLDFGRVVSRFVGQGPERIRTAFREAAAAGPMVLLVDEIDSFITSRDAGNQTPEQTMVVNVMLTELVEIRRSRVLVVAATNRMDALDPAAVREGRFDFKIEVPAPDAVARLAILRRAVARMVPRNAVDADEIAVAAARWAEFSVKRLYAIAERLPSVVAPGTTVGYPALLAALREVQGRKAKDFGGAKSLDELVLAGSTVSQLHLVARRMDVTETVRRERLGGSLPRGVLFFGPSGTGKTAAARALAMKSGWAFLTVTGSDLLADPRRLEEVYTKAKDLRPAIVFIDEADDVLAHRQGGYAGSLTAKLLTVLDGAEGYVKDVVFFAATNFVDRIDPAMLRGGRFTEKVEFFAADEDGIDRLIERWLASQPGVRLELGGGLAPTAAGLSGCGPADVQAVLQYALNLAIDETSDAATVIVRPRHIDAARTAVLMA